MYSMLLKASKIMHILLLIIFTGVVFLPHTSPFLTEPASVVLNYASLNLTCSQQIDTLYYNGTITYQYLGSSTPGYYCSVAVITSLQNNLTQTVTSRFNIMYWNQYRNFAINRCGFSTTMDIGYGNCTPYYFQTATSIQLCICSTNNCSDTYSICQASVNQARSSPPPSMPVLQPTLSNIITCQDADVNMSVTNNIIPPTYLGCTYMIKIGDPDFLRCSSYSPNRTIICAVFYYPIAGSFQQVAMIEGDYEPLLLQVIEGAAFSVDNSSGYYQYQTSTSIAILWSDYSGSELRYGGLCFCTTNNCNGDFATCTQGMNIPSYLLAYNGSTSSVSTGTSSSGTTVSSGSTTAATTRIGSTSSSSSSSGTIVSSGSTTATTTRIGSTSSSSSSSGTTVSSGSTTAATTRIGSTSISSSSSGTIVSSGSTTAATTRIGSTSSSSSSSGTTVSSGSTTAATTRIGSTSSSSSSIITRLPSSTPTSITTWITVSSTGVGTSNTSPSTVAYRSLGIKCNRSFSTAALIIIIFSILSL